MREWQSQSHVRWYCRYHIVIVPKYRKKTIYGVLGKGIGGGLDHNSVHPLMPPMAAGRAAVAGAVAVVAVAAARASGR